MRVLVIGFAIGDWLLQQQAGLWAEQAMWLALAAGLVLATGAQAVLRSRPLVRGLAMLAAGVVLGGAYAGLRAEARLADELPGQLEGRDIAVTGVIASLPQSLERGVRFEFEVETSAEPLPHRISLAWYRGWHDEEWHSLTEVHAGERWHLTVRLKRPHGNLNPHGFDFEAWLLAQDIRATGYVRSAPDNARLAEFVWSAGNLVERLRESVRARFNAALPDEPYAGVLVALAVGDQRAIDNGLWRVFNRTGITHLVSISGLHVTMVAALFGGLLGGLWRRVPALALRLPARQAAVAAGFVAALGYTALAGWGVPAQRTLYMLGCAALALWLRREVAASRVLALALLVVLVIDPWAVLSAGFWLSFGAVALLFLVSSGRLAPAGRLAGAFAAQWAVTLGMLPALLILFQQFSLVSPLANAIAIPAVSLVVTPLALAFAVWPMQWLAELAHWLLVAAMWPVEWLASLPLATWQQAAPPAWLAWLALVGCLWAMLPRGTPGRHAGLLALVPLVTWSPQRPAAGELRATVLDVGQGLAVHVQTAGHDLLYDTGPAFSAEANSGERILLPYLRAQGVGALDMLMVTHADNDHAGGALAVLEGLPVAAVRASLPDEHPVRLFAPATEPCLAGQRWEWDGVEFEILHPARQDNAAPAKKSNDLSCVLRVASPHGRLLLTADIEAPVESALMANAAPKLPADVVVAPHHGSRTSSSEAFVTATAPRWVVFPVGYRNRFRHPHPDVWARWSAQGASLSRTDAQGAVVLEFASGGVAVRDERSANARYWHGR